MHTYSAGQPFLTDTPCCFLSTRIHERETILMKKTIIALLLIAMLLPFASCASGDTTEKETSGNAPSETSGTDSSTDTETTRMDYPDNLPEMDCGGKTYMVLGDEGMYG